MSSDLKDYYNALSRLKSNKPQIVPRGTTITFDSVALEAGKSKGSIKAKRPLYSQLRVDILQAKEAQQTPELALEMKIRLLKAEAERYKLLYEAAIAREISRCREIWEMKSQLIAENEARDKHKLISIFRRNR